MCPSWHKLNGAAKQAERAALGAAKKDRRQSGSEWANVTGCLWARVIIDDYG